MAQKTGPFIAYISYLEICDLKEGKQLAGLTEADPNWNQEVQQLANPVTAVTSDVLATCPLAVTLSSSDPWVLSNQKATECLINTRAFFQPQ